MAIQKFTGRASLTRKGRTMHADVTVTIDIDQLVASLGQRALANRSLRAGLHGSVIEARASNVTVTEGSA